MVENQLRSPTFRKLLQTDQLTNIGGQCLPNINQADRTYFMETVDWKPLAGSWQIGSCDHIKILHGTDVLLFPALNMDDIDVFKMPLIHDTLLLLACRYLDFPGSVYAAQTYKVVCH